MGSGTLFGLLQPLGGLFGGISRFRASCNEPRFRTTVVHLGDVGQVWGHVPKRSVVKNSRAPLEGTGVGLGDEESLLLALGEGLERYSTAVYTDDQFILASADELGSAALDLDAIPRCSNAELSNSRCPLIAPDKEGRIRWVRSISLLHGTTVYVPAVMVYLYTGFTYSTERFWLPITTGCAAHTSLERALLSAIFEVIERDAISIVWLQKLGLPRIEINNVPRPLVPYWDRYQRSSTDLEYVFFDATTDLGVPTIYGLQVSRTNKHACTLVSCSTGTNPADVIAKVIRDMAACRVAFRNPKPVPEKWEEFKDIFHGASYMARAENAHSFDFLMSSSHTRPLSEMVSVEGTDDKEILRVVLERFRRAAMEVCAVDLTTDEALRSGMRVVRVIIPALQPLSFHYLARFLGHPRLYEAPKNMGYPIYGEDQLNKWPQPFA